MKTVTVLVVGFFIFYLQACKPKETKGNIAATTDTLTVVHHALQYIDSIERITPSMQKDTFDIEDLSPEGGEVVVIKSINSGIVEFDTELFFETGKVFSKLYPDSLHKVICLVNTTFRYDKPMYMEDMKITSETKEYNIFLHDSLFVVLNNERSITHIAKDEFVRKHDYAKELLAVCFQQMPTVNK